MKLEMEELQELAARMTITTESDVLDKLRLHQELCDEIHGLYRDKNNDYGFAIEKGVKELGWCYLYSQLWNKLLRFINLSDKKTDRRVIDESLEDTLMDLANYAIEGVRIIRTKRREYPESVGESRNIQVGEYEL